MSERTLKLIFALVVLVLVASGQRVAEYDTKDQKEALLYSPQYNTASLVNNEGLTVQPPALAYSAYNEEPLPISKAATSSVDHRNPTKTKILIKAPIYLLADLNKNENIFENATNKRWPIASLTKLMTAVVALEEIPPDVIITISEESSLTPGTAGDFLPGKKFSLTDLVKAMIVSSSNDAASALEEFVGREKFAELMNASALRLGMHDTFYKEATGLSVVNQSTAHDLKVLGHYIWNAHNEILAFSRVRETTIVDKVTGSNTIIRNINAFAGEEDFLGGKTGYINESGGNLISIFLRDGRPIITVVLGASDRFLETKKLMQWFDQTLR